jgi:hypothetical protein
MECAGRAQRRRRFGFAVGPVVGWATAFNRAFTNGNGNYCLTDEPGNLPIENNAAWHALQIINRNQEK